MAPTRKTSNLVRPPRIPTSNNAEWSVTTSQVGVLATWNWKWYIKSNLGLVTAIRLLIPATANLDPLSIIDSPNLGVGTATAAQGNAYYFPWTVPLTPPESLGLAQLIQLRGTLVKVMSPGTFQGLAQLLNGSTVLHTKLFNPITFSN